MNPAQIPELVFLESVMSSRIGEFKHHLWKMNQIGYEAVYLWIDMKPAIHQFKVTRVLGNGLLDTDLYGYKLYPSEVSFEPLAAVAILYFKIKDMNLGDYSGIDVKRHRKALHQTKMLFFKMLTKKAKETI